MIKVGVIYVKNHTRWEKTIDNERQFNKSLLPRWKQKWLVFKLGLVVVSGYDFNEGMYNAFLNLERKF